MANDYVQLCVCCIFIVHIRQVYQRRGTLISEETIKAYVRKQIQKEWNITDDLVKDTAKTTRRKANHTPKAWIPINPSYRIVWNIITLNWTFLYTFFFPPRLQSSWICLKI